MLLRVVAHGDLVPVAEVAEVGFGLAGQDAQQAGLAGPVEPQHQQPVATTDVERDVFEHRWATVALRHVAGGEHRAAARRRVGELHPQRAIACTHVHPLRLEAGDLLLLAVRHRSLGGLGAEAIHHGLQAGDLLRLQVGLLGEALFVETAGGLVLGVGALVLHQVAQVLLAGAIEVQHAGDRFVEQLQVVADDQQRATVVAHEAEQPGLGVDVEVVGWLVEEQHVAAGEEDARQLDAAPLATAEHPDGQLHASG